MRRFLNLYICVISLTIIASACSTDSGRGITGGITNDDEVITLDDDDVLLTSRLIRFNDCDTLLEYIHTEAAGRVGAYGFEGDYINEADTDRWVFDQPDEMSDAMDMDMAMAESDDTFASDDSDDAVTVLQSAPTPDSDTASESGSSISQSSSDSTSSSSREDVEYSETNIQELGVDEADIIKTDGERIFVIDTDRLAIVDVASRTVTGTTEIADGWNTEMFLSGDSLLVIQEIEQLQNTDTAVSEGITRSLTNSPGTVIQRIEVRDGAPEVVSTLRVEGQYVTSRSVNGIARVVLRSNPRRQFPFVQPISEASRSVAEEANRLAVMESTLEDWLPVYDLDDSGWQGFSACENVHAPAQFSGFGVTTVLTLPVDGEMDLDTTTSVLAPGDALYASTTSLYTTSTAWAPISSQTEDDIEDSISDVSGQTTSIHRFDITDPDKAIYVSSGGVPGSLHNQFSLSEYDGHLRVVTTTRNPQTRDTESQVRVLRTESNRLVEVGQVGNIGQGELVQSVRFVGDIGFVVTFRQIDPFYTIDLSDPTQPIIRGELKIPGFSSYLHPINDDYVLGVGSDATDSGRWIGTKVSLFDVSNLDNPREVAVWTAPGTRNAVGEDHRLFLWWAPKNLAVIPLYGDWTGAAVLKIADGTITEVGRIEHADPRLELGSTDCDRKEPAVASSEEEPILICRRISEFPYIAGSRVIGSELWTLSFVWDDYWQDDDKPHSRLQVNHIDTLDYIATVYIH